MKIDDGKWFWERFVIAFQSISFLLVTLTMIFAHFRIQFFLMKGWEEENSIFGDTLAHRDGLRWECFGLKPIEVFVEYTKIWRTHKKRKTHTNTNTHTHIVSFTHTSKYQKYFHIQKNYASTKTLPLTERVNACNFIHTMHKCLFCSYSIIRSFLPWFDWWVWERQRGRIEQKIHSNHSSPLWIDFDKSTNVI